MKTLSAKQLKVLGSLSNQAYRQLAGGGLVCESYNDWRRGFTFDIVGKDSWRACEQVDFIPLQNAFRAILGLPPKEDNTPQTPEQRLLWTILNRCEHWELNVAYVAEIVAKRFGRPWAVHCRTIEEMARGMEYKELLHLLYTIQARARKLVQKEAAAHGMEPPAEVHTSRSTIPPARLAEARGDIVAANCLPKPGQYPAAIPPPPRSVRGNAPVHIFVEGELMTFQPPQ